MKARWDEIFTWVGGSVLIGFGTNWMVGLGIACIAYFVKPRE